MTNYQRYFLFLRYSLQSEAKEFPDVQELDWQGLYIFSCEQAIAGVVFEGVKRLGEQGVKPPFHLLMEWLATAEQIKNKNKILNERCVELTSQLEKEGFHSCILKGQGNAVMYPNPYSRTPGDIDVWILGHTDSTDDTDIDVSQKARKAQNIRTVARKRRGAIIQYAKSIDPKAEVRYYHVEFDWDGVPVELHFMPGIMNNPVYNGRLQRWYKGHAEITENAELPDGVGRIPVPTKEFNIVFQLAHMMHHFFDEGVGLKHMVDYYYLLTRREEHDDLTEQLKHFNLYAFAGAVMYVMKTTLAMDDRFLIVPVDEKRGQALLKDIKKGGNFGRNHGLTEHFTGKRFFLKLWRNMHFVCDYPAELLCEPVYRTWHFFWRRSKEEVVSSKEEVGSSKE